jgi:hypothetical protein
MKISGTDIAKYFLLLIITLVSYNLLEFIITHYFFRETSGLAPAMILGSVFFFWYKKFRELKHTVLMGIFFGTWSFVWSYYWDKL